MTVQETRIERNYFGADLIRSLGEAEDRTVELSFSSESRIRGKRGYMEHLDHAAGAVDLEPLIRSGAVLFNHDPERIVAGIVSAAVENGRGVARVKFARTPAGEEAYQLVQDGILRGVSVGAEVQSWETVQRGRVSRDGRFTGPCRVARRWFPFEISLVAAPADLTVGIGRSRTDTESIVLSREMCRCIYEHNRNVILTGGQG